ncbi:hypothetical protein LXA43DRAFT_903756, partial [Ganoderma leucocontextum]
MTTTELFQKFEGKIADLKGALTFLRKKDLVPPAGKPTPEALVTGLLLFAGAGPAQELAVEGLIAFAHYARAVLGIKVSDSIADAVMEKLGTYMTGAVDAIAAENARTAERMEEASKELERTVEGVRSEVDALREQASEWREAGRKGPEGCSASSGRPLYADVLRTTTAMPLAGPQARVAEREILRQRQVLVDGLTLEDETGGRLSEEAVVARANEALTSLTLQGAIAPEGAKFTAAKVLRNGGTVLELESAEAAEWVRENAEGMEKWLGGKAKMKARTMRVVA